MQRADLIRYCKMQRNTTKAELFEKVDYIRSILGITLYDYPINIFDCVQNINDLLIVIQETFFKKDLGGFTIKNTDMPSVILMNNAQKSVDKNFALAHELIHFFCHEYTHNDYYSANNEKQANEGAAELLLPYKLFLTEIQTGIEYYGNIEDSISNTAKAYYVAKDVAKYRYSHLDVEREQFLSGVPIDEIKVMKRSEWEMSEWTNT